MLSIRLPVRGLGGCGKRVLGEVGHSGVVWGFGGVSIGGGTAIVGCGVLAACVVFLLGRVVWFWPRVLWLSVFACLGVLCGMVHSSGGCVGVVAWVRVGLTGREAGGPWYEPEKGD